MKEYRSYIAGLKFSNPDGSSRMKILAESKIGEEVRLIREPENAYDKNAIKVVLRDGRQIGYVPAFIAMSVAEKLDAGVKVRATVSQSSNNEALVIEVEEENPSQEVAE